MPPQPGMFAIPYVSTHKPWTSNHAQDVSELGYQWQQHHRHPHQNAHTHSHSPVPTTASSPPWCELCRRWVGLTVSWYVFYLIFCAEDSFEFVKTIDGRRGKEK